MKYALSLFIFVFFLTPHVHAQTTTNEALIQKLLAQIVLLQAELAKLRGTTQTPPCTFTRLLKQGTQGTDVTCLQNYLKSKGHFTGTPTGLFGPVTEAAVTSWQKAEGIVAEPWEYGHFGEQSRVVYARSIATLPQTPVPVIPTPTLPTTPRVEDTTAPSTPGTPVASLIADTKIILNWASSTDNTGVYRYRVYRGTKEYGISKSNTFTVTGLSPDTLYNFAVVAYDRNKNDSPQSGTISVRTLLGSATPIVATTTPVISYDPAEILSGSRVFYVDANGGNDANPGTSSNSAWKRFPGMDSEAVTRVLSSGDTVCLKGGVTWTDSFQPVSGVTYKGNCKNWGTGRAIVVVSTSKNVLGALIAISTDNWSLEAIDFSNENKNQSYQGAAYIEGTPSDPVTNVQITDCSFNNSGQGLMIRQYVQHVTALGITAFNNTYKTIPGASSGILIAGPGTSNIKILGTASHKTELYENGRYAMVSGRNEGRGITIGDNVSDVSVSGIYAHNNGEPGGQEGSQLEGGLSENVTVTNSFFDGNTAAEIKKGANHWNITGNIFRGTSSGVFQYGYEAPRHSSNSIIANNVIVSRTNTTNAAMKLSSPGTGMEVRNNVVMVPQGHTASAIEFNTANTAWAMSTWDNNVSNNSVYGGSSAIIQVSPSSVYTNRTLAQHRLAYPNQAQGGSETNPLFEGGNGIYTTTNKTDFKLSGGSPLIGAGKSVGNFTDSFGNTFRNPPSIGAFESNSVVSPNLPTTDITPEMFGGIGNGVADDTVALQATLTECSNKNTTCSIPAGKNYRVTGPLYMWGGANLTGTDSTSMITFAVGVTKYVFNIGIDAPLSYKTKWTGVIKNVTFTMESGTAQGRFLQLWRSSGATITNCIFNAGNLRYSFTGSGTDNAYVSGLENYVRRDITISRNTINATANNIGSEGIGIDTMSGATIVDNIITGVGDDPIGVHISTDIKILRNTLKSVDGRIFVANSKNVEIGHNTVSRMASLDDGTWYPGIALIYVGFETLGTSAWPAPDNITVHDNNLTYPAGAVDQGGALYIYGPRNSSYKNNTITNNSSTVKGVAVYLIPAVFTGTWTDPDGIDNGNVGRVHEVSIDGNVATGLYPQIMQMTGASCADYVGPVTVSNNTARSFSFYCESTVTPTNNTIVAMSPRFAQQSALTSASTKVILSDLYRQLHALQEELRHMKE